MPRRGPPHSFGWLMTAKCPSMPFDVWERPDGYQFAIERGAWFEMDGDYFTIVEPTPHEVVSWPHHA